jgi:beta-fructofuranosidase
LPKLILAPSPADNCHCVLADDTLLMSWRKDTTPFLALPPPAMDLTGWRDPFVVEKPCAANQHTWVVLIGSGIKNVGGTALVYRVQDLRVPSSWVYDGLLCLGDGDTGEESVQQCLAWRLQMSS